MSKFRLRDATGAHDDIVLPCMTDSGQRAGAMTVAAPAQLKKGRARSVSLTNGAAGTAAATTSSPLFAYAAGADADGELPAPLSLIAGRTSAAVLGRHTSLAPGFRLPNINISRTQCVVEHFASPYFSAVADAVALRSGLVPAVDAVVPGPRKGKKGSAKSKKKVVVEAAPPLEVVSPDVMALLQARVSLLRLATSSSPSAADVTALSQAVAIDHGVVVLTAMGTNATIVNGVTLPRFVPVPLLLGDVIQFLETSPDIIVPEPRTPSRSVKRAREPTTNSVLNVLRDALVTPEKTPKPAAKKPAAEVTVKPMGDSTARRLGQSRRLPLPVLQLQRRSPSPESTTAPRRASSLANMGDSSVLLF
jgi:hypothetical protein